MGFTWVVREVYGENAAGVRRIQQGCGGQESRPGIRSAAPTSPRLCRHEPEQSMLARCLRFSGLGVRGVRKGVGANRATTSFTLVGHSRDFTL
jgi:hypothetical protein